MAKTLPNMTPSNIITEARARFRGIEALFDELALRVEPLEETNRVLGEAVTDARERLQGLEGQIGLLRDVNSQLLQAFGAAARKHPDLANEFMRLKGLAEDL